MLKKIIIFFKFYKFKFKSEGVNCHYKGFSSVFMSPQNITLGDNVYLGKGTEIDAAGGVIIGNGVIFGPEVCMYSRTHNFDSDDLGALPFDNKFIVSQVTIKDYVWIGRRVLILPGVTIGKAAIIGAGSIVSRDVPDYAVAAGNPAKVIRYRNKDLVEKILAEKNPFVYNKFGHKKVLVIKKKEN
jgi:acetyltransferase-like isoleucine patch superfamily enzyme